MNNERRWEYKVHMAFNTFDADLEDTLKSYGVDGWELVSLTPVSVLRQKVAAPMSTEPAPCLLVFKRSMAT